MSAPLSHRRAGARTALVFLAVSMALTPLSACAAAPSPASPESPASSASASPSDAGTEPSTAETSGAEDDGGTAMGDDPQILADCPQLLDVSTAQTYFSSSAQFIDELSTADALGFLPGPVAQNALNQSTQVRACLWGIPQSDGGFAVIVAELPAAEKATLVTALGSSAFTETSISGTPSWVWMRETEVDLQTTAYMFIDPFWITVSGSGSSDAQPWIAEAVADKMRALYPSLGG